ncbi:MAG TPA: 2OG-Fe(II) oxygenase family protein [Candidatus Nanoarchaeia archaeon]|nr:2OG-Fe(II) oxygenase family protein [Candidatus Nanoarchaeia archaeon]
MTNPRIDEWVDSYYFDSNVQKKLRKEFETQKPFPYLQLKNFLQPEIAVALLNALAEEEFTEKESDLFKLMQTSDFVSTQNELIAEFRAVLASKEFAKLMYAITGITTKAGEIDCNGSMYQDSDFLLPHDDQLEGRKIAYMYYLSTMKPKDGGPLALFSSQNKKPVKVVKQLYPEFNSFTFFKVLPISFHEVQEVVAQKQRISINGWFHG